MVKGEYQTLYMYGVQCNTSPDENHIVLFMAKMISEVFFFNGEEHHSQGQILIMLILFPVHTCIL